MDVIGVNYSQVEAAVEAVSAQYGGNLTLNRDARPLSSKSFRGRVVARDSRGPGARASWSGRRGPWACWHAYRDVMLAIFDVNPNARVKTALADYRGKDGFLSTYPATAHHNIGSMMQPAYMPELCDC